MSDGSAPRPLSFIAGLGFEEMPAAEVSEQVLGCGYDEIEWTMAHIDELLQPASALACQQDLVCGGDEALQLTLSSIERAHEAQIGIVNVLTGPNLWEHGATAGASEERWATALGALEQICARGDELGVVVGLEPCWGTLACDASSARRALDAVPVSVTFDPSHFVMTGDDIAALVHEWGERIVHVHLKDAFGSPGIEGEDFQFCMLGEGKVDWPEFFAALDAVGYSGALSIEFEAYSYYEQVLGSDPRAAAVLAAEQARALIGGGSR